MSMNHISDKTENFICDFKNVCLKENVHLKRDKKSEIYSLQLYLDNPKYDLDKVINLNMYNILYELNHDNFEKIRKIYDTPPKSYKEVLDAKVEINKYKQQINRIKIRNAKSVLSSEQIAFKKETLIEIKKLQKTYDKIYKDFYKDQQPKKGRPKKSKA